MSVPPSGVAVITGASRGVGAESAIALGSAGLHVVICYREKKRRALAVSERVAESGGSSSLFGGDLTDEGTRSALLEHCINLPFPVRALVLNASGGMEATRGPDYAMLLNRDTQASLATDFVPLLRGGGRIVFLTSHQAHFIRVRKTIPEYARVAESKRAGEDALLGMRSLFRENGIDLVVVSADVIRGTATAMLLERARPGLLAERESEVGELATARDVASAVATASTGALPEGGLVLLGQTASYGEDN